MLHNDEGWRLSPAFDLVPNIGFNREMEVHEAALEWPTIFTAIKVPAKDAESIGRDISQRLEKCLR